MWRLVCIWAVSWITASTSCLWIPGACGVTGAPSPHWPNSPGECDLLSNQMLPFSTHLKQVFTRLSSCCCVGVEPAQRSEIFHRLFLPSVMDGLLSLASHLMRRAEVRNLFLYFIFNSCLLNWLDSNRLPVSVRLSSEKWWQIPSAGCSEHTLSWLRRVGHFHRLLISS